MPWGSYVLKSWGPNSNLTIFFPSTFATFKFFILYNPIYKGRVGHGAFFFLCNVVDNPVSRWYDTSCMKILSVAYLGKTCGGFSPPNTLMKVPPGEAFHSVMSIIALFLLVTCKVDLLQRRACTTGWWSGQLVVPLLLDNYNLKETCNRCAWNVLMVSMSIHVREILLCTKCI